MTARVVVLLLVLFAVQAQAQDLAKVVILAILAAGVLAWTFFGTNWFTRFVHAV